jgi:hypothetical protein
MTAPESTAKYPITTPPPTITPGDTPPIAETTDTSSDSADGGYVPVLSPVLRLLAGVVVIIAALWWSLHFDPAFDRFGYIPVMFVYMIIMIIGGALMVTGAIGLWSRLTATTTSEASTTQHSGKRDR